MASLGLKLFYLRTREKQLSQREVAAELGIRQGTLSYIEQEITAPQWSLLVDLCRFYDVTPTFLADEDRGVIPLPTERWGLRDALITIDMWVELDAESVHELGSGKRLCRIEPGSPLYDEEAASIRREMENADTTSAETQLERRLELRHAAERKLEKALRDEMSKHPRQRRRP